MNKLNWTPGVIALVLLPAGLLTLLAVSLIDGAYVQPLFVHTTYYFLMATLLCWLGTYLHAARDLRSKRALDWLKENWPGILIAFIVTVIAWLAVHPALRILSDEANLLGTSKNLFSSKTPTFTVSGKNYYDSYWDIDVAIDRRPTLFPFLVSLVHAVCGYSYQNVFRFNLAVLPAFVFVSYRLAKSLAGETCGVVTALLVVAHPITLISARSGGFDFFTLFVAVLVLKSLHEYLLERSPDTLAILWMNLCLFANTRYEGFLFIPPLVLLLLAFKLVPRNALRPYAFIYAFTPALFLPRIWQAILRGNVPEQDPGAVPFSIQHFFDNASDYFKPLWSRGEAYPVHSTFIIALGVVGCALWLGWLKQRLGARDFTAPRLRFAVFVVVWLGLQSVIVFSYVWGKAQFPSAARLLLPLDTFFSFAAAWVLSRSLQRFRPFVSVLIAAAVLAGSVPVAAEDRIMNRLTQTRENATTWRFFESLNEKRILIVTEHPNLYTIMNYGAMSFVAARQDPFLFTALARHLFYDVYVIQQIQLSTGKPLPADAIWPTHELVPVLEFQNDANVLIRISRVLNDQRGPPRPEAPAGHVKTDRP